MKVTIGKIIGMYAGVIVIVLVICSIIGALLWPYTINAWLDYAGKEPCILWWHGALLGFAPVIGQITIPAAIGTWILMLFLA